MAYNEQEYFVKFSKNLANLRIKSRKIKKMRNNLQIDNIDRKLLRVIQKDSRKSVQELGVEVGLSGSACHRRLKAMEDHGLICKYKAILNAKKLGFQIMLFIQVSLSSQSEEALIAFEKAVLNVPEILECYLMAGNSDFLLRVVCRDQEDFERLHRRLLSRLPGVSQLHTNMSIRTLKADSGLPV